MTLHEYHWGITNIWQKDKTRLAKIIKWIADEPKSNEQYKWTVLTQTQFLKSVILILNKHMVSENDHVFDLMNETIVYQNINYKELMRRSHIAD